MKYSYLNIEMFITNYNKYGSPFVIMRLWTGLSTYQPNSLRGRSQVREQHRSLRSNTNLSSSSVLLFLVPGGGGG